MSCDLPRPRSSLVHDQARREEVHGDESAGGPDGCQIPTTAVLRAVGALGLVGVGAPIQLYLLDRLQLDLVEGLQNSCVLFFTLHEVPLDLPLAIEAVRTSLIVAFSIRAVDIIVLADAGNAASVSCSWGGIWTIRWLLLRICSPAKAPPRRGRTSSQKRLLHSAGAARPPGSPRAVPVRWRPHPIREHGRLPLSRIVRA